MKTTESPIPYQQMQTTLLQWVDLKEPQWQQFTSIFQLKTFHKQEYILFPGAKFHQLYFVYSGLLRFYYIKDDGME